MSPIRAGGIAMPVIPRMNAELEGGSYRFFEGRFLASFGSPNVNPALLPPAIVAETTPLHHQDKPTPAEAC